MHSALLRGRDHTRIGMTGAIAEGRAAIALSRGGAAKAYRHRDPHEDAALFAEGAGGILLAVADGHGGCDAAEAAIEKLLAAFAPAWTAPAAPRLRDAWVEQSLAALAEANAAILERVTLGGADTARTTLALALLRPGDDLLAYASLGDSHIFRLAGNAVFELGREDGRRVYYLGFPSETPASLAGKHASGAMALADTYAVVLVTDGLSEQGIGVNSPDTAVQACVFVAADERPDLRPLRAARGVVERALDAHRHHGAGDNVAAAVAWP